MSAPRNEKDRSGLESHLSGLQTQSYQKGSEMNLPTNNDQFNPTMSSREIAELVEKRHDSVKRTIEMLIEKGLVQPQSVSEQDVDTLGRTRATSVYLLQKRDSYVVVAQLSPEFTARLVDRWQELESKTQPVALSGPQLMAAALVEADATMKAQTAQIEKLAPKAAALDRLDVAEGALTLRPASKVLGYPERKLAQFLQANRWAFRSGGKGPLQAHVDKRNTGYLDHKLYQYRDMGTGEDKTSIQMVITPKGMARLAKIAPTIGGA